MTCLQSVLRPRAVWLLVLGVLLSLLLPSHVAWCDGTDVVQKPFVLSVEQQAILAEEANRLYESSLSLGDADRKEQLERGYKKYQLLANAGQMTPELFFNLGNSALQLQELGHAIAYFEQARRLAPGNRTIAKNLRFAREKLNPDQTEDAWTAASEFNFSLRSIARWIAVTAWCVFWIVVGLQLFQRQTSAAYGWLRNGALLVFLLAAFHGHGRPNILPVSTRLFWKTTRNFDKVTALSLAQTDHSQADGEFE